MSSGPRVLVVDDDAVNRKLLADLVSREGAVVEHATGGREALEILGDRSYDLVLLDIMMPEVDGTAVLAELGKRGALPALPVVVITANDDRATRIAALRAGAVDFMTKPIDRLEVGCRIRTLLELGRLREIAREHAVRKASEELYERVHQAVRNLPLYIYRGTITDDGQFATDWVVGDVEGVTGVPLDTYLQMPNWLERVHPDNQHEVRTHLESLRRQETSSWRIRYRILHPDRGEAWVLNVGNLDFTERRVMGATLDISAEKGLEERLVQAMKMQALGQLAGGVAHDFNNILTVILSFTTLVREELAEDDPRQSDLEEVLKATHRAVGLTRQLLTFSRQQPSAKEPTDLNERLADLHKLLATSIGSSIALNVRAAARPAIVCIDPVQFDQVMLNLAVNARDAMPEGGRLDIAIDLPAQAPDAVVRVTVRDTGAGMDARTQQRIFEPFFTTKAKGKGTGLGLATSFGIIEDAGGTMRVDSSPGGGATFTIDLPSCGAPISRAPIEANVLRRGRGETVLVVEDEPALSRVMARVLGRAGYDVTTASDGTSALRMIDELGSRIHVIVTDVVMPGCSGYDVVAHAEHVAPQAAVILTSGYLDEVSRRNQREDLPLLWKPVPHADLVRAVGAAIATRATALRARDLVLIVDGNESDRHAMASLLATGGYTTIEASTAADVTHVLETHEPALVVCDASLEDVVDLLHHARPSLWARTLLVGDARADARVLPKPVDSRVILEALAGAQHEHRPVRPRTRTGNRPAAKPTSTQRKERVLVVEDDESIAAMTARALADEGYDVVTVGTLDAARRALAEELDALVIDVNLPDGEGFELLDVRGPNSELPIVTITGAPSIDSATRAVRSRVHEYLAKPFAGRDLVHVVRSAIEAGRLARLRTKLLAARFGGDELILDLATTERHFAQALPKIRMVYQPIVRAGDGSVYGYEALLRCDEPTLSSPLRLLAAAEVLGRVVDVGRAVRASVASTILSHRDRLESIFVNLHPFEFRADLLGDVTDPLMPLARRVVLEVTERASLESGADLDDAVARIRAHGYRVAVDDLGEGYAGLSSLVSLRPDIAKLDMSLVRDVQRSPLKRDIVAAIVEMARRSGITVVAEGIETVDERDTLVELGCDLLQGYLFAKPGPAFPVVA